ncbi:MAG: S8 family serine peptidase [Desulfobulbaceae bacterium]|nr:S8 family serine peptidase [Desulfobulbaceae bacterium]
MLNVKQTLLISVCFFYQIATAYSAVEQVENKTILITGVENEFIKQEEQYNFEYENDRLSIVCENISYKRILFDLENNTGIGIKFFGDIPDRKVTFTISSLPVRSIDSLLSSMGVTNFAFVYDTELAKEVIYILQEGQDERELLKSKPVILSAGFASKDYFTELVQSVKGREVAVDKSGKHHVPIRYISDEIIIKFHLGITPSKIEEILKKHNLIQVGHSKGLSKIGYIKTKITDGRKVYDVLKTIRKEKEITFPEPNYVANILTSDGDTFDNDPLLKEQWYIENTKFDQVWPQLKAKRDITVAVVDSGVKSNHEDLTGKILTGYDFVNNDANPDDDNGHGTFVTGIIAAQGNEIGTRGLYGYAKILPVKVIDQFGYGTFEDVAAGIIYAADMGAAIINLSIGSYGRSLMLQDAIDYALEKRCVVIAAGGNDGIDQRIYPAAYPDVMGVSAINKEGNVWSFSNSGSHIDIAAPGINIISTGLDNNNVWASGTSASAAMVSAVAAMLANERPNLSSFFIKRLIAQAADNEGATRRNDSWGYGRVDSFSTLNSKLVLFHDVAISKIRVDKKYLEKKKHSYIVVDLMNYGTFKYEKSKLVVYVNNSILSEEVVSINFHKQLIFPWAVKQLEADVKISAYLEPIRGELLIDNNKKTIDYQLSQNVDGLFILHKVNPGVHQWIAGEAFFEWPNNLSHELFDYIGNPDTVVPTEEFEYYTDPNNQASHYFNYNNGKSIITGAMAEDGDDNPFGETGDLNSPSLRHFWDRGAEDSWNNGYLYYDSAVNRAYKYWSGGYGYNNEFDSDWTNGYGIEGEGVKWLYLNGDAQQKALAYEYLGHIVHLLVDMSVPAHVHNDAHQDLWGDIFDDPDQFEVFMTYYDNFDPTKTVNRLNFQKYGDNGDNPVDGDPPSYTDYLIDYGGTRQYYTGWDGLYYLFLDMAEKADNYESDGEDGGEDDDPSHYNALFDVEMAECAVHQQEIQPYVILQVAALYKWFWYETHTPPDLIVPSISVSDATLFVEDSFTLSATVQNDGQRSSDSTILRYYLSTDSTITNGDTEMTTVPVSSLDPASTSLENVLVTAPETSDVYWVGACVDPVPEESPTTNNCSSGIQITVSDLPTYPDLVVLSPSVDKSSLQSGESLEISATVKNIGDGAANSTTLRYYLSVDSTITTSDTALPTDYVTSLEPNATSIENLSISAPASPDTYWIGACVDTVSGESTTTNNCSTGVQITVVESPAYPDLVVILPSVNDPTLQTSESFTIFVTVKNDGGEQANSTVLRYYLSIDSIITTGDTELETNSIISLAPGSTSPQSTTSSAPLAAETYWVGACVDPVSDELSTTNNCSTGVQITVSEPPAYPDLIVMSPEVDNYILYPEASFTISATVKNDGGAQANSTTLRYYRSVDSIINTDDIMLTTDSIVSLAPAGIYSVSASSTAPTEIISYWVGACVDPVTAESSVTNNCSIGVQLSVVEPPQAPWDFDGNGTVNYLDLQMLADHWLLFGDDLSWDDKYNLDETVDPQTGKQIINYLDLNVFADHWLEDV